MFFTSVSMYMIGVTRVNYHIIERYMRNKKTDDMPTYSSICNQFSSEYDRTNPVTHLEATKKWLAILQEASGKNPKLKQDVDNFMELSIMKNSYTSSSVKQFFSDSGEALNNSQIHDEEMQSVKFESVNNKSNHNLLASALDNYGYNMTPMQPKTIYANCHMANQWWDFSELNNHAEVVEGIDNEQDLKREQVEYEIENYELTNQMTKNGTNVSNNFLFPGQIQSRVSNRGEKRKETFLSDLDK